MSWKSSYYDTINNFLCSLNPEERENQGLHDKGIVQETKFREFQAIE